MLKQSIDLHRQGRFDEAEQGYRAQLAENPDDADTLHLLGMLRYQRGDAEEGSHLLARARALAPDDANLELSLASLAFRAGDYDAAERGFARALVLDPNLAAARAGAGQIALLRGQSDTAEQHFRIALRAGEEPHALAGLGALLLERGDLDAALRHLGRAADLAPSDAMIQLQLGQAFARRDTPAFAEQAYLNALRLRPDLHQVRPVLAALLLQEKRTDEAAAQFRTLLVVPGFETIAHVGLADVARTENRWDDAAAGYRAALALDPTQPATVRALAWTLLQLGRHEEAVATYEAFLSSAPDDRSMQASRADLLMVIGRLPQAAVAWKELVDLDADDIQARSRFAMVAEYLGEPAAANAHAQIVLRARPDDAEMQLIGIRALMQADADADALDALAALGRHALSEGQNRLRLNYLGRLHDRAGDADDAVRCFVEAQRGMPSALPPLHEPSAELSAALCEPAREAWASAPILLLGTPGSGVERVAALLADQPELIVLRDRIGALLRDDDFNRPRLAYYSGELNDLDREALRERWLAPLRAGNIDTSRRIVDWLPRWDAHLLGLIRRALPGTRLLIVERDPRDALLNWLAFGWAPGFAFGEPAAMADWLARARQHLAFGGQLDDPRRLVVAADPLLDAVAGELNEVAQFLGIEALRPGPQLDAMAQGLGGLPVRFVAGHWQRYRDVLADAFARLA
ncbi:MAG: tetratricopeptide repeat protein [Dokdonella sp.]